MSEIVYHTFATCTILREIVLRPEDLKRISEVLYRKDKNKRSCYA